MNAASIILASLLVLGLCSATPQQYSQQAQFAQYAQEAPQKHFSNEQWMNAQPVAADQPLKQSHSNEVVPMQLGSTVDDIQEEATDNGTSHRSFLDTGREIRDYLTKKISQVYNLLAGHKNKAELDKALYMNPNEMPVFPDPYQISDLYKNYKLAYMNFTNVNVYGMSAFNRSKLSINKDDNKVELVLNADNLLVTGNYTLSNLVKKASGIFKVQLKRVTYTESDTFQLSPKDVDIVKSEVTVRYDTADKKFQDIGFFTQLFEGVITNQLMKDVLPQIGNELGQLMRTSLLSRLRMDLVPGYQNQLKLNRLEEIVKSTMSEARNLLKKEQYTVLKVNVEPFEVRRHALKGQVTAVYLKGLRTFEVEQLTMNEHDDKIRIDLQVRTGPLSGYVNVMTKDQSNLQWVVDYKVPDLVASIALEKQLYNDDSLFDIVQGDVQVKQLEMVFSESHTEPWLSLFKQLPKALEPVMSKQLAQQAKLAVEELLREGHRMMQQNASNLGRKIAKNNEIM